MITRRKAIVFEKLNFQNVFPPDKNAEPVFSNSCSLNSGLKKLCFRGGLFRAVSPAVEMKLRFQISPTR